MKNEETVILTIQIKPRNYTYVDYIINDGKTHSKKYGELAVYLSNLFPDQQLQILKLLDLKRHFIILPQEKRIIELQFDFQAEMTSLSENTKHESVNSALKTFKEEQTKKLKDLSSINKAFDNKISNMSGMKENRKSLNKSW